MNLSGRNIITVPVCSRCGRGFLGEIAKSVSVDSQPVWWTQGQNGPMCGGQVMHMDRMTQIERVYGEDHKIITR